MLREFRKDGGSCENGRAGRCHKRDAVRQICRALSHGLPRKSEADASAGSQAVNRCMDGAEAAGTPFIGTTQCQIKIRPSAARNRAQKSCQWQHRRHSKIQAEGAALHLCARQQWSRRRGQLAHLQLADDGDVGVEQDHEAGAQVPQRALLVRLQRQELHPLQQGGLPPPLRLPLRCHPTHTMLVSQERHVRSAGVIVTVVCPRARTQVVCDHMASDRLGATIPSIPSLGSS